MFHANVGIDRTLEHARFKLNRGMLQIVEWRISFVGEPISTPDRVGGRLSPGYALATPEFLCGLRCEVFVEEGAAATARTSIHHTRSA